MSGRIVPTSHRRRVYILLECPCWPAGTHCYYLPPIHVKISVWKDSILAIQNLILPSGDRAFEAG